VVDTSLVGAGGCEIASLVLRCRKKNYQTKYYMIAASSSRLRMLQTRTGLVASHTVDLVAFFLAVFSFLLYLFFVQMSRFRFDLVDNYSCFAYILSWDLNFVF
jgi:hypothetical protein